MSNKFNEFEEYFINTAIQHAVDTAEEDVKEMEKSGKRSLYATGYFTLIGKELTEKITRMTKKQKS